MIISIDGQQLSPLDTQGRTIGDLLTQVRNSLTDSGRMIVEIVCDGEVIDPDRISALIEEAAETYGRIDFQTAHPAQLARDSLDACREFLSDIEDNAREIVDHLRQAQVPKAMKQMEPMFSRINDAYRGLQGTFELFKIDPESIELSAGDAARFMAGLKEKLKQIRDSLENRDYVELADLFEYELGPAIRQWQELNDHLRETISSK